MARRYISLVGWFICVDQVRPPLSWIPDGQRRERDTTVVDLSARARYRGGPVADEESSLAIRCCTPGADRACRRAAE
jgi:hypothetical protein